MYSGIHIPQDTNYDYHCDICGKFVDATGWHNIYSIDADNILYDYFHEEPSCSILNFNHCIDGWLSDDEKIAVADYASNDDKNKKSSVIINKYLRDDGYFESDIAASLLEQRIYDIGQAIYKYEVREPFFVYRTFGLDEESKLFKQFEDIKKNGLTLNNYHFTEDGFLSTTYDPSSTKTYANKCLDRYNTVILLKLKVRKGKKAMPIFNMPQLITNGGDKEVLFDNSQYIYMKNLKFIRKRNKNIYIIEGVIS